MTAIVLYAREQGDLRYARVIPASIPMIFAFLTDLSPRVHFQCRWMARQNSDGIEGVAELGAPELGKWNHTQHPKFHTNSILATVLATPPLSLNSLHSNPNTRSQITIWLHLISETRLVSLFLFVSPSPRLLVLGLSCIDFYLFFSGVLSLASIVNPRLLASLCVLRFFRLRLHNLGIAPYRPHLGLNLSRCRNRIK